MSAMNSDTGPHRQLDRSEWRAWLLGPCLVLSLSLQAVAEPRVAQTIRAPYAPEGYTLQLTEDCEIVSRGGAPDAYLRCAPGLGWRLQDTAGGLIYPKAGYLPSDTEWAFAGDQAVAFASNRGVTLVKLPSGSAQVTEFSALVPLHLDGADVSAVLWKRAYVGAPSIAAPLLSDGSVGPQMGDKAIASVDLTSERRCLEAMAIALLGAEQLPNRKWSKIVREPSEAPGQAWTCDSLSSVRFAGRSSDGRWWALDPLTFKALSAEGFDHVAQALAAVN